MNKKELSLHTREQKDIINAMSMSEVVTKLTGDAPVRVSGSNYKLICPIHGKTGKGYNSTIKDDKIISCWSQGCYRGDGVFSFLDKYYLEHDGISDYLERFKKIDALLGTKLYLPIMAQNKKKEEKEKEENLFTKEFLVDKYCLEESIQMDLMMELISNKTSILNAGTGTGKTYFLAHFANYLTSNKIVDKVFFLTPRRSLVEEIGSKYADLNFKTFMGDDAYFDSEDTNIVATTHKAHRINSIMEMPELFVSDERLNTFTMESKEETYVVIIDECHLLHTSRNIVGNIEEINRLIENSAYTIFTSANTNHFYKACKDFYGIETHISVKRKERLYNLETLSIKRVDCKESEFFELVAEMCLKDNRKYLVINNNINENKAIANFINASDKNKSGKAVSINSKNKNDEEAYEKIIKNSILKERVTICTSIIDTGINIEEENITTIIVAPSRQFDDISIIQGFARVRTTKGNHGILVLKKAKNGEEKNIVKFDETLEYYKEETERLRLIFNKHMFDYFTQESYEEYKAVWGVNRDNELYENSKVLFRVDGGELNSNPMLVVDDVMLYEFTRKKVIRANYYNDKYVLNILKDINAKNIFVESMSFKATTKKEKKEKSTEVYGMIEELIKNTTLLETLTMCYEDNYKLKDIKVLSDILEESEEIAVGINRNIKKFLKLKTIEKMNIPNIRLVKSILEAFTTAAPEAELDKIKWRMYNDVYGTSKDYIKQEFLGSGDLVYTTIRDVFDGQLRNKRKVTAGKLEIAVQEYSKLKGYEVENGVIGKKSKGEFKEIRKSMLDKITVIVQESIKAIYVIDNEGKIVGLNKLSE